MKHASITRLSAPVLIFVLFTNFTFSQAPPPRYDVDSLIAACMEDVRSDSIENYLQFLEGQGTRFLIAPNRRSVAESIKARFLQYGADQVRIDSFLCATEINMWNLHFDTVTWQYNVVGILEGVTDGNQSFVMGGHYDNVVAPEGDPMIYAPGADDNASGVVAMFECLRVLSLHQFQPVYDIEFVAFAAEELMYFGNSGAQAFVDSALAAGRNMELMINNDMIAYTGSDDWELQVSNYVGSQWITGIAEEIAEQYTLMDPVVQSLSGQAGADCKYFYEAGVPCVYFMEMDFNPYYHTEQDLTENCDIGYITEAVKVSLGSIIKASDYIITGVPAQQQVEFAAYPNPTRGELTVELSGFSAGDHIIYQLTDLQGRQLMSGKADGNSTLRLGMHHLPEGMYLLSLRREASPPAHQVIIKGS